MVWKMKKIIKVNIFMRFVCHSLATLLSSYSHQNQKKPNKFRTGWSVRYKKKVEAVNRSVTKEVAFQNLANCKLQSFNFTSKKLFLWFLSRILLNFQVISHDISQIGRSHITQSIYWWLLCSVLKEFLVSTEAVVPWTCSEKKIFLKISKHSQENICMGVSFLIIKLQPSSLQLYQKRRSNKFVFLWILRNF